MSTKHQLKTKAVHARMLFDVLNTHADTKAKTIACHQLSFKKSEWSLHSLTFAELREKSIQYADVLKVKGLRQGDRVLLCLEDPSAFVIVFLGIMAAGCIPVPLPAPSQFGTVETFTQRIRNVCIDCEPRLVVTSSRTKWEHLEPQLHRNIPVVEVLEIEQEIGPLGSKRNFPHADPAGTAFLQYTSGSTGNPKGIVITHGNIAANISGIIDRMGAKAGEKIVSWLPLYHDMGLIGGLLAPLYGGLEAYLLTPLAFIMRPVSWLRAITDFKADYTIGPTYAYNVAANKIPNKDIQELDLSSLKAALVGAEPIDRGTVEAFINRFAGKGFQPSAFYPVYGMAEATLAITFPPIGKVPHFDIVNRAILGQLGCAVPSDISASEAISFISVGTPLPGHHVSIQDPSTGKVLPDRTVGQIVTTGPSVSPYYFADAKAQYDRRHALRTGDLGYFADGNLYIADRLKDLIIVAGQNYIPSDIEFSLLTNVSGLRFGRVLAFSTKEENVEIESLRIVAELPPRFWRNQTEIRHEIKSTVFSHFRLQVSEVLFLKSGTVPRTSSGKLQRRVCRDLYLKGKLRALGENFVKPA